MDVDQCDRKDIHALDYVLLFIFIQGVPSNISDERIAALTQLKETLNKNDPSVLFNVVNELSVVSRAITRPLFLYVSSEYMFLFVFFFVTFCKV